MPRTLRAQLLIPLGALVLCVVGILSVVYSAWFRHGRDHAIQSSTELANAMGVVFSAEIDHVKEEAWVLGAALVRLNPSTSAEAGEFLAAAARSHPAVHDLHWVNREGRIVFSAVPEAIGLPLGDMECVTQVIRGSEWSLSGLFEDEVSHTAVFAVARGIHDQEGRLLGAIVADIDPRNLTHWMAGVRKLGTGRMALFDSDGVLVYEESEDPGGAGGRVGSARLSESVLGHLTMDGPYVSPVDEQGRIAAHTFVGETGWVVVASSPLQVTLAPVTGSLALVAFIMVLVTLVCVMLSLGVYGRILRGVQTLGEHARLVSQGDLQHRVTVEGVAELHDLGTVFNQMTEGLADAERHKARYREELELKVKERTVELSRVNADLRERIAAHERAVEALRLSEARLAKAQAIAHLGNWEWDLVTGEWQWSDEVDRILGAPSQHLSSNRNDFLSLVHPEDRERARRAVSESLRSGNAMRLDLRTVTPGGEVRTVHIRAEVASDETGRPACMTGTVLDISERVRAEAEAKLREHQLVHADRMASLGILAAGVAHEINNPNHSILSNASVLRKIWTGVTPVLDRYSEADGDFAVGGSDYSAWRDRIPGMFGSLVENSNRIKTIVQELRAYARQDATEPLGAIDLNAVVRSAHILLKAMVKESTNRFDIQLAADLPLVRGNFQRLEQVVINLIQNACQALPDKDRGLSVTTAYDTRQDLVVMEVQDEGIGILEKDLRHITDPFFTTKREAGGTGLGLWISSNIVHEHHGALSFRSDHGAGTIARVALPRLRSEVNVESTMTEEQAGAEVRS